MIDFLLVTHLVLTATVVAIIVPSYTWGASVTFVSVFCFWSINFIAVEIEHPFGDDYHDLPVRKTLENSNAVLQMILGRSAQHIPSSSQPVELMRTMCNSE